ncbi:MAG TPA: MFS transporter [Nocardioidaceae bacterium]|nr:MFS transporter [Nocardioidaceae bacterium]
MSTDEERPAPQAVPMLPSDSLFTKAFVMLGLADLAYFTAVGVAVYALPLYATGPLGSGKAGAGLAFGAFAVSALVLRPFVGRLSDTIGRLPLIIGGALLAAVALALTASVDSLAMVIALRLLAGVAEASFFVATFAALADLAPPSRMGEALSYNSLGLYLGLAFGPPLGELLVETWSFDTAWYGAAGLATLAAVVALGVGETLDRTEPHEPEGLLHRKAIPASLGFFASLLAVGGFMSMASLHAHDVGLANTSLPLFVYGVVVVFCRVAFAKVPDRLSPLPLGAAALAAIGTGLLIMALWTQPEGMLLGVVLAAIGVSFSTPAFFSAIFATARPSEHGSAAGTASLFIDLGLGFGPIMLGYVADSSTIPAALGVGAGCAAVGLVWTLYLERRSPVERD